MKVVVASTEEQVEKLNELIQYVYTSIFPRFFTDEEIKEYISLEILHFPREKDNRLYTLETAFRAITSLEVIISIIEGVPSSDPSDLFEKNANILKESGLSFPFSYQSFLTRNEMRDLCSQFIKPANEYLV